MPLKVALQMDTIEDVNINGDTTFALGLGAQKRGHELYYYQPHNLSLIDGKVIAKIQKITLKRSEGDHFSLEKTKEIELNSMDVVLMRQDPPFDMNYLTYSYMLDKISDKTLVVNNPTEVRNCPEKLFVTDFVEFTPKTLISADKNALLDFFHKQKDIVIKPLYAHGGADVFRVSKDDVELTIDNLLAKYRTPIIAQEFLKDVTQGDKRIILIDGEAVGAVNRLPPEGEFRANFVQGGVGAKTTLTPHEKDICAALKPELKRRGLLLAGIDVIGGYLTEINVTSPTGIQSINALDGVCLEAIFWDAVEKKLNNS